MNELLERCIYFLKANAIQWYTDGSKTHKGTGARVLGVGIKYSHPMGTYPSVFQADVLT